MVTANELLALAGISGSAREAIMACANATAIECRMIKACGGDPMCTCLITIWMESGVHESHDRDLWRLAAEAVFAESEGLPAKATKLGGEIQSRYKALSTSFFAVAGLVDQQIWSGFQTESKPLPRPAIPSAPLRSGILISTAS